ncbi:MAG: class I SAM-dependent methyltransferase [Phenylobacterium sp.]
MAVAAPERDTDADWRELGRSEPYWAVISHPDFRSENLTPEGIETFYRSGREYIADTVAGLERATGARPSGGRALDFGCGVGRLAEAMTDYAHAVVGLDVSPGMLELARGRNGKATYAHTLPDGHFDWINSFIVLQHIEPVRGMAILDELLSRLAPGGFVSLQLTIGREARDDFPLHKGLRSVFNAHRRRRWVSSFEPGIILMYDYDLSAVVRLLDQAGVAEMSLVATDHDGHHGVIILGRKAQQHPTA